MTDKPRIRIVTDELGRPFKTRVFNSEDVDISSDIERLVIDIDVNKPTAEAKIGATVYTVAIHGELMAEVEDMRVKIIPPPAPKAQYRFRITEGSKTVDKWVLEKVAPLPTLGVRTDFLCGGAVAKGLPLIELVGDVPESED